MCGIAGALDLTGLREFPLRQLLAMTTAIAHRGPDDEQVHIEPGIALGARRLAIIDPAHGQQPIANESGEIWTTVNGELFDYPTIRENLLTRGHTLTTHCDSEAWVHLYEDYGEAIFDHTKGQFAVALWDRREHTLILGRDRVGIAPLYYVEADGWLLWGSEIKALLASGLVAAEADLKGIDYLFNFHSAPTHRTFFKNIKLLPPGHFLRVKNGRIELHQYWDFTFPNAGDERHVTNHHLLVDELDDLLTKAVQRRLHSDVPIVSYLSGGLDSSVILEILSRQKNGVIPSFSIGMERGSGPDEKNASREVAALLDSTLTMVPMNASMIAQSFPEFITVAEGPVLDTSCAALMHLAAEINKQGFKVALTGEGADEALAGYIWFKSQKIGRLFGATLPRLGRKMVRVSVNAGKHRGVITTEYGVKGIRPAQQYIYEATSLARQILYSDEMWQELQQHDPYSDLDISNEKIGEWDPLNQSLYVGYKVMLAGLLMISKSDRIAMHSSVETRFPFLDEDVIEFCSSIAPKYKLNALTDKWLLRELAAKRLGTNIAKRPKTMFRSKLSRMFLAPDRPAWVDQLLSVESLQRSGYFDPAVITRERRWLDALPRITPRQHIFDAMLTCVITTQLWHHIYCGGGLCELPVWKPMIK